MGRDEIMAKAFEDAEKLIRPATVAMIGGFRPTDTLFTSAFGGKFVGKPGEEWPESNGNPMIPLLQVRVGELPFRPKQLDGIELFNVFVDTEDLPEGEATSGDGWLIRTYSSADGLTHLEGQLESDLKHFQIRWNKPTNEGPDWEDARTILNFDAFSELDDASDQYDERYTRNDKTKIGGWPSYIQGATDMSEDFVFQIGSESKCGWAWGDGGTGYVFFHDGQWTLTWDCF